MKPNKKPDPNPEKRITPIYLFSYLVLSNDTWRLLFGVLASVILTPKLSELKNLSMGAQIVLGLMLVCIGWWLSAWPAAKIAGSLRAWVQSRYKKRTP